MFDPVPARLWFATENFMKNPTEKVQLERHIQAARLLREARAEVFTTYCDAQRPRSDRRAAARLLGKLDRMRGILDALYHSSITENDFRSSGHCPGFPWYSEGPKPK
jgi:hypothetical protein